MAADLFVPLHATGPSRQDTSSCREQRHTCEVVPPVHVKVGLLKAFMVAGQGAHHGWPGTLEDQVPAARQHTIDCGYSTELLRLRPDGTPGHELMHPLFSPQEALTHLATLWRASKLEATQGQPLLTKECDLQNDLVKLTLSTARSALMELSNAAALQGQHIMQACTARQQLSP